MGECGYVAEGLQLTSVMFPNGNDSLDREHDVLETPLRNNAYGTAINCRGNGGMMRLVLREKNLRKS